MHVCKVSRKIIFRVLFGLKKSLWTGNYFWGQASLFFLRAWSFVSECAEAAFILKLRRTTLIFLIDLRRIRLFKLKGNYCLANSSVTGDVILVFVCLKSIKRLNASLTALSSFLIINPDIFPDRCCSSRELCQLLYFESTPPGQTVSRVLLPFWNKQVTSPFSCIQPHNRCLRFSWLQALKIL